MVRNGDIRGFFAVKSSAGSSRPESAASSPAAATDDQQLPSSPRTPPRSAASAAAPRRLGPQDEIMGSDDEDSDDSLESLSALIGGGRKTGGGEPAAYERPPNDGDMTSTPRAKRVAFGAGPSRGSPLTLQQRQQQQHKFDLKALISHTRQSERTEESARRAEELIREVEDSSDSDEEDGGGGSPSNNLKQVARELLDRDGNENEDEEGNPRADKIARAIDRTQAQGARRRCYFFDPTASPLPQQQPFPGPASARAPPFPVDAARGTWRFLADPNTRDQAIINGLPHTIVASRGEELPEELFLWMLDRVCAEGNPRLRTQYCGLLVACAGNTRRLVDGARLYGALEGIGGPKYDPRPAKLKITPEVEEPYRGGGRDNWAGLGAFLDLLRRMAPNLEPASAVDGVKLLLRMGLDPVLGNAVRGEHLAALEALVAALPATEDKWNAACTAVCSYVLQSLDDTVLRAAALSSVPKSTARLADLRRRLAAAVLFSSPSCSPDPGDFDVTNLDLGAVAVRQRLSRPDFAIRPTTDFEELRVLVWLLDAAVGDASCFLPPPPPPGDEPPNDDGNRAEQERRSRFDAEVDALTFRLRALHDGIHDNGLLARKEAKAAIDAVTKRLTYAVRTRPPAKTSIFDPPARDDVDLPKQRDFMKNWVQRRRAEGNSPAVV
ncbi:hypothetical protein DL768_006151 [Monosporascus sp. mg162]|nr:hypothetical protein DL768_006151 [Monosporascus sp. mg162]